MSRNTRFHPSHEPFCTSSHLQLQNQHISGPFSFLNPTTAPYIHTGISKPVDPTDDLHSKSPDRFPDSEKAPRSKKEQGASDIHFQWRSRDNRKGRHALSVEPDGSPDAKYLTPKSTSSFTEVLKGIGRMFMQYPYWDISYLVAIMFALGSVVWVINAFFVWLPLVDPSTKFPGETGKAGGITAFIGATIFEIGSVFLMFEAVNENQPGCFGWALERALEGGKMQVRADKEECSHHHRNRKNLVGKSDGELSPLIRPSYLHSAKEKTVKHSTLSPSSTASDFSQDQSPAQSSDAHGREWQWFPSWHDLTTHYVRELGFLACSAQFLGATIFWISGFTALPGIANKLTSQGLLDGVYWVPQIVGGTGFIVSGTLFMLETQPKWYIPAPKVLGWHIGLWNMIGAFGFTLSGALGPAYGSSGAQYESSLSTFWGSWAFLIGSLIQWYESLDKHPVEENSPSSSSSSSSSSKIAKH